jgi:protein TonB
MVLMGRLVVEYFLSRIIEAQAICLPSIIHHMKQLIPLVLLLVLNISCRKITNTQVQGDSMQADIVAENIDEDFICMLPCAIDAEFPGKTDAWKQFLQQNLVYPAEAVDMNVQGAVVVQFIVGTDGSISEIEAMSGPAKLKQSAIDVIKKSPNWIPAQMHGRNIKSYKRQPIIFRLEEEE